MDILPDDILLHIFSFLRKSTLCLGARLTCTRWWQISKDVSLWKELIIPVHFTDNRFVLLMNQIGKHVEELDCAQCEVLTSNVFFNITDISSTFPTMKRLCLPIEPASHSHVSDINEYFSKIQKLFPNLEAIENISSVNTEQSFNVLECQSYFPCLKAVYDKPCSSFGRINELILKYKNKEKKENWCSSLSKLQKSCKNVTEYRCTKGTGYIDCDGLKVIGSEFPCLKTLELRLCSITDEGLGDFFSIINKSSISEILLEKPGDITDRGLGIIAANLPHLKKVKLSRCSGITRKGLKVVASKCKEIISLHINNSVGWGSSNNEVDQIDDECIQSVVENCKSLEIFRILYTTKMTYKSLEYLRINCYNLRALMFFECPGINDKALEELSKIKFLRRLVLVNTKASAKAVLNFIITAPFLNSLTLYCNESDFQSNMTDLGEEIYQEIDAESFNYRPNMLKSLTVRGIGSAFLQLITVLSPNLLVIDLRDTVGITTNSLKSVLVNCEVLHTLDISCLPSLDPSFLLAVAQNGKTLRKLNLGSSVHSFKNEHFNEIVTISPCLEMISMDIYDSGIIEKDLESLIKEHHGGYCYAHVDPECDRDQEFNHRFISFHFVPKIYLESVNKITNEY